MHEMFTVNIEYPTLSKSYQSIHINKSSQVGFRLTKNIKKTRYKTWINELLSQAHSFYRAEGFPQDDARLWDPILHNCIHRVRPTGCRSHDLQ